MVAAKKRRTDLEVPPFVKEKWEAGGKSKDMMAELLKKVNFDKDPQHHKYNVVRAEKLQVFLAYYIHVAYIINSCRMPSSTSWRSSCARNRPLKFLWTKVGTRRVR